MDDGVSLLVELLRSHSTVNRAGVYPATGPGLERADGRPVDVLVGGRVAGSHERAARSDGWLAAFCSSDRFASGASSVQQLAPTATLGYQSWIGVGDNARADLDSQIRRFYGIDPAHFERYTPVGDGAVLADHFVPYVSAGATVLNLFPAGDPELGIDEVSVIAAAMH